MGTRQPHPWTAGGRSHRGRGDDFAATEPQRDCRRIGRLGQKLAERTVVGVKRLMILIIMIGFGPRWRRGMGMTARMSERLFRRFGTGVILARQPMREWRMQPLDAKHHRPGGDCSQPSGSCRRLRHQSMCPAAMWITTQPACHYSTFASVPSGRSGLNRETGRIVNTGVPSKKRNFNWNVNQFSRKYRKYRGSGIRQ